MKINTKITISLTKEQVEHIVIEHLKRHETIKEGTIYARGKITVRNIGYGTGEHSVHEFDGMDVVVSG